MKCEVHGRVVGHSIFKPNSKIYPDLELVKVSFTVTPATRDADNLTKAVLVVDRSAAWQDLVLGRMVRITIEDEQQDLVLPKPSETVYRGKEPGEDPVDDGDEDLQGTVSMRDPETGKELSASMKDVVRASKQLKEGRLRRSSPRSRAH